MADYLAIRERILEQEQALIRLLNFQFVPRMGESAILRVLEWHGKLGLPAWHAQILLTLLNDK